MSDLIGHCVDHPHYTSTVPHVIASAADFDLASDKTKQTGCGSKDYRIRLISKCAIAREPSDGTFNLELFEQ